MLRFFIWPFSRCDPGCIVAMVPQMLQQLLRISSTIVRCCSISGPFWAIIRGRSSRMTHSTHIRNINKTLLDIRTHASESQSHSVSNAIHILLNYPVHRTPVRRPRDPRLNQTVTLCRCPGEALMHSGLCDFEVCTQHHRLYKMSLMYGRH